MRRAGWRFLIVAMLCLTPAWSVAETVAAAPPDPATLKLPDLAAKPSAYDAYRFGEYFFFNKPGAPFAAALADIDECFSYSASLAPMGGVPDFVPLGAPAPPHSRTPVEANALAMWGLVGVGIVALVEESLAEDNARANLRRCMFYKGYRRYGMSRANWDVMNKGEAADVHARMAMIAGGPEPSYAALTP